MNTAQEYDAVPLEDLETMRTYLQVAAMNVGGLLAQVCKSTEQAHRQVRLAQDLPPRVLLRRAERAYEIAEADGIPSAPELAAYVARIIATVANMQAAIDRKTSGASLQ